MEAIATAAQERTPTGQMDTRAGKYLVFELNKEECCIQVLKVKEIMGVQDITAVPQTPDYLNKRFVKSLPKKNVPFAYPPDVNDGAVYQDEFVAWLNKEFPKDARNGGQLFYVLKFGFGGVYRASSSRRSNRICGPRSTGGS